MMVKVIKDNTESFDKGLLEYSIQLQEGRIISRKVRGDNGTRKAKSKRTKDVSGIEDKVLSIQDVWEQTRNVIDNA